ncbi:1811_t:CDS:1, partial [Ambispora gerdemannii]
FGVSGALANAAKESSKITSFFGSKNASIGVSVSDFLDNSNPLSEFAGGFSANLDKEETMSIVLCEKINQLREDLLKNAQIFTAFEYNKRWTVYEYFVRLDNGDGKMQASEEAANVVYVSPKSYTAKWIRALAKSYLYNESFPLSRCDRHQKHKRLVDNEDIAL